MVKNWMQVGVQLCGNRGIWMDRMHNRWFNVLLFVLFFLLSFLLNFLLNFIINFLFDCIFIIFINNIIFFFLRVDVVWIYVVMIVRCNIPWVITCSRDTICSPRMIKDIVVFLLCDAKVVVITNLMERILNWMRPRAPGSQSKLEFKEASTGILIPNMFVLFSAWQSLTEIRIGHWSERGEINYLSVMFSFFHDLDLFFWGSFCNWLSRGDVFAKNKKVRLIAEIM